MHWAALYGLTMRDARDAVFGFSSPAGETTVGGRIQAQLTKRGAKDAAALLGSVLYADTEERGNIMSTASRPLKGYRLPGRSNRPTIPTSILRNSFAGEWPGEWTRSTS